MIYGLDRWMVWAIAFFIWLGLGLLIARFIHAGKGVKPRWVNGARDQR